jgi:hypothetical protein
VQSKYKTKRKATKNRKEQRKYRKKVNIVLNNISYRIDCRAASGAKGKLFSAYV